jgi:hypothetical protein
VKIFAAVFLVLFSFSCKVRQEAAQSALDDAPSVKAACICRHAEGNCVLFRPGAKSIMHTRDSRGRITGVASFASKPEACTPITCRNAFLDRWVDVPLDDNLERPGCGGTMEWRDLPENIAKAQSKDKATTDKAADTSQDKQRCLCKSNFNPQTFDSWCSIHRTAADSNQLAFSSRDCGSPKDCTDIFGSWGQVQRACRGEQGKVELEFEDLKPAGMLCRRLAEKERGTLYCVLQNSMDVVLEKRLASVANTSCKSFCEEMLKKHQTP